MEITEIVSKNIKRIRRAKGMTQEDLARRLGVSQRQVAKLESNHNFQLGTLAKMAKSLDVRVSDLVWDDSAIGTIQEQFSRLEEEFHRFGQTFRLNMQPTDS